MRIIEELQKPIKITALQRQSLIIVTMLSTILLLKIWPLFMSDAMSLDWPVYVVMIAVAAIPLFFGNKKSEE